MLFKKDTRRDIFFYMSLFFVVFFINVSYYVVPQFDIDFYKDSSYFVWLLSMRLDMFLMIIVFYVKTALPKSFKLCLLCISFIVVFDIINILPFDNNNVDFYLFSSYVFASFLIVWVMAISSDKIQNKWFSYRMFNTLNQKQKDAYLLIMQGLEDSINKGDLTPKDAIDVIKDIKEELINDELFK